MTERFAVLALLEARPGKEQDVEAFLQSALPLVRAEPGTTRWYALKLGPASFAIFDTFADEQGRTAHLRGDIATALFARAGELFDTPPSILLPDIVAAMTLRP